MEHLKVIKNKVQPKLKGVLWIDTNNNKIKVLEDNQVKELNISELENYIKIIDGKLNILPHLVADSIFVKTITVDNNSFDIKEFNLSGVAHGISTPLSENELQISRITGNSIYRFNKKPYNSIECYESLLGEQSFKKICIFNLVGHNRDNLSYPSESVYRCYIPDKETTIQYRIKIDKIDGQQKVYVDRQEISD